MSTAGIASIALFAPVVASNAIISARRASRGVEAMDENPLYGLANIDLAAAQVLKGGRAAKALAVATNESMNIAVNGAAETIKAATATNKFLKGVGKVINFTADNINPIICVTSGIKVLGSEDKVDTTAREILNLSCMFGAESLAKNFVGLPYSTKENNKRVILKREGSYKKLFTTKQLDAIQDLCATKKCLKYLPGVAKGLFFVGASIGGYKLGEFIGDKLLGKQKQTA